MGTGTNNIDERILVTYAFRGCSDEADARSLDLALEQTVELPEDLVPAGYIRDSLVGRVESIEPSDGGFIAAVSYDTKAAGGDFSQFLNLLFGNSSIKPGIRIESVRVPDSFARRFPGPRFGVSGLRDIAGVRDRPLTCTALKPLGLGSAELADLAYRFALGGIDFIKDDHGIADQEFSPFRERVARCAEAVALANRESGNGSRYVPNITGPVDTLFDRARFAKESGAGGVLISPAIVGFDAVRALAADSSFALPIFSHPAFSGGFVVSAGSGISHAVLYGTLARLAGADASIFPNYGGRFAFSKRDCVDLSRACLAPLSGVKAIMPVPAGGMSVERVEEMRAAYGDDFVALVGGALQRGGAVTENSRALVAKIGSVA